MLEQVDDTLRFPDECLERRHHERAFDDPGLMKSKIEYGSRIVVPAHRIGDDIAVGENCSPLELLYRNATGFGLTGRESEKFRFNHGCRVHRPDRNQELVLVANVELVQLPEYRVPAAIRFQRAR